MRSVTHPRPRTCSARKPLAAKLPCPLCQTGSSFHIHCMICCRPLEFSTMRKTCAGECRAVFKTERRKGRSIRCWITPLDNPGKRFLGWVPRRALALSDTGVSRPSGARRAILPKKTTRKPKRSPNG
jgi:predicted nucleic acid-binding Zn ribbon protein